MTILVVDDDKDFRDALADNLRDDGHCVREFASPADLPSLEELRDVDALISDYQMHPQDGLTLADRFHAAHASARIVLVTAYWSHHLDVEVARRKFLQMRRKPVDYEEIQALLLEQPAPTS